MSVNKSDPDLQQEELLLRLQSQFGDMDLTQLLEGENGEQKEEADDASEESSLAEPSAEELKAWQEAQFHKGQKALERKRQEANPGSAIKRRRAHPGATYRWDLQAGTTDATEFAGQRKRVLKGV